MMYEEYEEIIEEAYRQHRKYNTGVRGQTITPPNSLDFWVYKVTKDKYDNHE